MTNETFEIVEDTVKIKSFLSSYPDGWDYDHSFIEAFRESYQQKIDNEDEDSDDLQNTIDELNRLIANR
jgi:hypothetical protein